MIPLVDINELHREFWTRRQSDINGLLAKPHLLALVAKREAGKARYVKLAITEADRVERIRHLKSFEYELFDADEEISALPIIEAQRRRAKNHRGKVTDDGKTLPQIVESLVAKPESCNLSAPELWPRFCAELDDLDLEPNEITARNPKKAKYSYQFKGKAKTITFGRFATLVSKFRNKSR